MCFLINMPTSPNRDVWHEFYKYAVGDVFPKFLVTMIDEEESILEPFLG